MLTNKEPVTKECPVCKGIEQAPVYMTKTTNGVTRWNIFCNSCNEYREIDDEVEPSVVTCTQSLPKFSASGPTRDLWIDTPYYIFQQELIVELKYRMKKLGIPDEYIQEDSIRSKNCPQKEDLEKALGDTIRHWENNGKIKE